MLRRKGIWLGGGFVLLLTITLPYLAAERQPSGFVFPGFLINPVDGFSYYAKMLQGFRGAWRFHLPYASVPGEGSFLFLYYLLLGHLQRALHASTSLVYHAARIAGAAAMVAAVYVFVREVLADPRARRWAFALSIFGSGIGWLGLVLGRTAIDLWVPEAFGFYSAFANAHFALASAAILVAFVALVSRAMSTGRRLAWGVLTGVALGAVQPFGVLSVGAVGGTWLLWTRWRAPDDLPIQRWRAGLYSYLAFLAGGMPFLAYDLWVTTNNSALKAWSAQNVTPTPPVVDVALGFGIPLVLGLIGAWLSRAHKTGSGRLLLAWLAAGLILAYLPLPLQRRMLLGLFFPMAILSGIVLARLASSGHWVRRAGAWLLFALCLPTNVLLLAGSMGAAARQEPDLILPQAEVAAYRWAAESLPAGSLVLTGPVSGNRLPAYAPLRVLYGHPFETPDASERSQLVASLFSSDEVPGKMVPVLDDLAVGFVLVGPRERAYGPLPWLTGLQEVYSRDGTAVYEVPSP